MRASWFFVLGIASAAAMAAACGDDKLDMMTTPPAPPPPGTPPPATPPPPPGTPSGLSGQIFQFSDAEVFGISSGIELRVMTLAGSPEVGPFTIKSLGNSDEASGTLTVSTTQSCLFEVTVSSFPGNAKLVTGARVTVGCAYDSATMKLRLSDALAGKMSEGDLCADGCGDGN